VDSIWHREIRTAANWRKPGSWRRAWRNLGRLSLFSSSKKPRRGVPDDLAVPFLFQLSPTSPERGIAVAPLCHFCTSRDPLTLSDEFTNVRGLEASARAARANPHAPLCPFGARRRGRPRGARNPALVRTRLPNVVREFGFAPEPTPACPAARALVGGTGARPFNSAMTWLSFRPNNGSHGLYRPSDIVNRPCDFGHSADTTFDRRFRSRPKSLK
jgi:hypothetical protein